MAMGAANPKSRCIQSACSLSSPAGAATPGVRYPASAPSPRPRHASRPHGGAPVAAHPPRGIRRAPALSQPQLNNPPRKASRRDHDSSSHPSASPHTHQHTQPEMASLTMMASFAAVAAAAPSRRGTFAVARAAKVDRCQQEPARLAAAAEETAEARPAEGRRAVMMAAAAACVAAIGGAGAAMAGPKNGTPEAKKKYAPICVTMPTAKVCHN